MSAWATSRRETAGRFAAAAGAAAHHEAVGKARPAAEYAAVASSLRWYMSRSWRSALAGHLRDEVVPLLGSRFRTEQLRRDTYSAVAEMTYLS